MNQLPLEITTKILSYAAIRISIGDYEKTLHGYAQINKHWYCSSFQLIKTDTFNYVQKFIKLIEQSPCFVNHSKVMKWKLSVVEPSFSSTMKDFSVEFEKRFEPLRKLESSEVDEMIEKTKFISFGLCNVFAFGTVVNSNLRLIQKHAIIKEIKDIGYSIYSCENGEILIRACQRLNYLGDIEDAVKIASTLLCDVGKKRAMAHFCYQCNNRAWRRDILGIAAVLWPDSKTARDSLKEIASEKISLQSYFEAFYLIEILGGEEVMIEIYENFIESYLHNFDKVLKIVKPIVDPSVKNKILFKLVEAYLERGDHLSYALIATTYMSGDLRRQASNLIENKNKQSRCSII